MILLLGFTFFYFQLAMVMAYGNFVHYATFMSARAFMAAGEEENEAQERAKSVIIQMLKKSEGAAGIDRFPSIGKGVGGSDVKGFVAGDLPPFKRNDREFSWLRGVRYTFRSKLLLIPLAGFGSDGKKDMAPSVNTLDLTSESLLGREPSKAECIRSIGENLIDNGC